MFSLKPHIYMQNHKERTDKVTKKRIHPFLAKTWRVMLLMLGLLAIYILIGSIDGPMPKDDDLYLPPPASIPDGQNVSVALMEIFGSAFYNSMENMTQTISQRFPYFSPKSPILEMYVKDSYDPDSDVISVEDKEGNVIMTVSNQVDFISLVDAVLATNECIATALARAVERPFFVNSPRSSEHFPSRHARLPLYYKQARQKRFLETKRYDEAIEDSRILLELSNKILNGYCDLRDKLSALWDSYNEIEYLADIASLKDADENILAKINALMAKYDLKDWEAFYYKMLRDDYSYKKHLYSNYSSLSLTDRYKARRTFYLKNLMNSNRPWIEDAHMRLVFMHIPFPLLDFCFHPNRILSLLAKNTRKQIKQRQLGREADRTLSWPQIVAAAKCLFPNSLGEFYSSCYEPKNEPYVFRRCRAIRLLVACRLHFFKTNKLPETVAGISPDILPDPVLDPVFNIPYEIKSWRDGDMMHVAAFTKDGPEEAVASKNNPTSSLGDGSIAHMSWSTAKHEFQDAFLAGFFAPSGSMISRLKGATKK